MATSVVGVLGNIVGFGGTIYGAYHSRASPNASLENSEKRLGKVKARLKGLSDRRREEIEAAARMNTGNGNPKSIGDLEHQLEDLSDMLCRLSKWYEDASVLDRHLPFTQYRRRVVDFEKEVKELLDDTWNSTVPFVDDLEYRTPSEQLARRPGSLAISSPESPDDVPTGLGTPRGSTTSIRARPPITVADGWGDHQA